MNKKPIQKEEIKEPELKVGNVILVEQAWEDIRGEYHDEYAKVLSIDNLGFMKLEFETEEINKFLKDCEYRFEEYKHCVVNEILFKSKSTSSDTFINENKLRDEWLNYIYNELFPGMSLINKETIATWWIDKLKSSLQSQRQSILEEIEKKKTDERKVYYFGKEPNCYGAETYQEKMLVNAVLEDIKQLLKDNKE